MEFVAVPGPTNSRADANTAAHCYTGSYTHPDSNGNASADSTTCPNCNTGAADTNAHAYLYPYCHACAARYLG